MLNVLKPKTNFHLESEVTKLDLITSINYASLSFDKVILHLLIHMNVQVLYTLYS